MLIYKWRPGMCRIFLSRPIGLSEKAGTTWYQQVTYEMKIILSKYNTKSHISITLLVLEGL